MTGTTEINTCPEAHGFIPQELTCRVRIMADVLAGVKWWRKLWRAFIGYYDCPCEGRLPCGRLSGASPTNHCTEKVR